MKFRRLLAILILTTVVVFAPALRAEEHAAGGHEAAAEHHHIATWEEVAKPLTFRAINFVAFIALLVFLARKPIAQNLAARRQAVSEAIDQAAERKSWAEKKYSEYDQRLSKIGQEISALKTSLKEEGEAEAAKMMAHASSLAEQIRRDTAMIAEAEAEDVKDELRREVVQTAGTVAKETVLRVLKDDDQERLSQEFISDLRGRS